MPVRIGFIGCGGNARGHMNRLLQLSEAKIVAVCDRVETLAEHAAEMTGADACTDHRKMLDRSDLDAVYLSIPVFAHGEPEMDVIDRGLPFLVEKPVARDLTTAKAIEAWVLEKNLLTAVGYQLRYSPTVDRAREILSGKRIGLAAGRYWCNSGAGDPNQWVRQMARSGGQLLEQATHTIDMMRCLLGEVEEVYTLAVSRVLHQIDCADFHSVAIQFEQGAVGSLTTSWASDIGWSQTNLLEILYEDSLLRWTYDRLAITRGNETEEITGPLGDVDEAFVHAVQTGDGSGIRSPYSDAVLSLKVSLAMNLSAREHRPVRLSELQ